jgi:hypothetical protein
VRRGVDRVSPVGPCNSEVTNARLRRAEQNAVVHIRAKKDGMAVPIFEEEGLVEFFDPKPKNIRRPRVDLVSVTVFLVPEKLQLIKQICAHKNRRISDLISDAVDEYLYKHG